MPTEAKIICGNAIEVLTKTIEKESIDTIYTCPSPYGYYDDPEKIGGKPRPVDYINDLVELCRSCYSVLKPEGNLFIQLGDQFKKRGGDLMGIPCNFENWMITSHFDNTVNWKLNDRLIWHRTETRDIKRKWKEMGFLKNFEYIFHFVKQKDFYFNWKTKWNKTSVFSYPLEDSYYTNEFDSGLPYQLSEMVIDTTVPPNGTILDPLCGSAKVGVVAKRMNRSFIGIDIDLETVESARIRLGIN